MENLQKTEKQEKGLLLKVTLILTFLGELFWTIIFGFFGYVLLDDHPKGFEEIAFMYSFWVGLIVGIFSFYAIYATSKMSRKGAYCLLGVYIVNVIIFTFWSYITMRYNIQEFKEYIIFPVLSAFISLFFAGIIWKNLKKMNS